MVAMAKKKPGRKKGPIPPRKIICTFKGTEEFSAWIDRLVLHCRAASGWPNITAASVIERALIAFAESEGFDETAPNR